MDANDPKEPFDESAILQHYDLLEQIGVLDQIEELRADVRFQREIIEEALSIFRETDVSKLIEYLISRILDRFVPNYLVFILRPQSHTNDLEVVSYRKLARVEDPVLFETLDPFVEFFERYPQPVSFSLLEHELEDQTMIEALRSIQADILVPISGPAGLLGIIIIGNKLLQGDYSNREVTYINRLMQFGSVALQNVIFYTSASRDSKTRLYNHSFFMNRVEQELQRYRRYGRGFSILLCDLDHFKAVNDTYGHQAGDHILFEFARILESSTRATDVVARYGGEEFVVLLVETQKLGALEIAERIRLAVLGNEFEFEGQNIGVTCSIGGYGISPAGSTAVSDVVSYADRALYSAKQRGRNRTEIYNPGLFIRSLYYRREANGGSGSAAIPGQPKANSDSELTRVSTS